VIVNKEIVDDINQWLIEFVEAKNVYTDKKWPVCPYARTARIKKDIAVRIHTHNSASKFIHSCMNEYKNLNESIVIMVFKPYHYYNYSLKQTVDKINETAILNDIYLQHGRAKHTKSKFPGLFSGGEYYICVINHLSPVYDGSLTLRKTDYYSKWSSSHWHHVVEERDNFVSRILKKHNKTINDIRRRKIATKQTSIEKNKKYTYRCLLCGYESHSEYEVCPNCDYRDIQKLIQNV